MLTLAEWFSRHAKRPFFFVSVIVFGFTLSHLYRVYDAHKTIQKRGIKQIAELVSIAINQKNRILLESLLDGSQWQLSAKSAHILNNGNIEISSFGHQNKSPSWLYKKNLAPIPGFKNYQLQLQLPLLPQQGSFLFLLVLNVSFIFFYVYVLVRIRNRFTKDILVPLQIGLTRGKAMNIAELDKLRKGQQEAMKLKVENAVAQAVLDRNHQIAHDIRSPLSALSMMVWSVGNKLSTNERLFFTRAVDRISDIANDLSSRTTGNLGNKIKAVQPLSGTLEAIVSEKRIEYHRKGAIRIHANLSKGYGLFTRINASELKRVISNLVNNSVDAIATQGEIHVNLRRQNEEAIIEVADNGCGIKEEDKSSVFKKGTSFGKRSGSGLGLYHANSIVEQWGGSLGLKSKVGEGTRMEIALPLCDAPQWFLPKLTLKDTDTVAIVDDDHTVHELWQQRLNHESLTLKHFLSVSALSRWFSEAPTNDTIFLVDYELAGENETGLTLITDFGIANRSILVTSHYDEREVQASCMNLGIKLLPKPWVAFAPIHVVSNSIADSGETKHVTSIKSTHEQNSAPI